MTTKKDDAAKALTSEAPRPLHTNKRMTSTNKQRKREGAREARERGQKSFQAMCASHGMVDHYASNACCISCTRGRSLRVGPARAAEIRNDPEALEAYRSYQRAYDAERRATDTAYLGYRRAHGAAICYRRVGAKRLANGYTKRNLPASYKSERKAIERFYAECPKGCQVDHRVPVAGELVSGLHCLSNLAYLPSGINRWKRNRFAPHIRDQRPLNPYPGGALDPEQSEHDRNVAKAMEIVSAAISMTDEPKAETSAPDQNT